MNEREKMSIVDESKVWNTLKRSTDPSKARIDEVLQKARECKGLSFDDVAVLVNISDNDQMEALFAVAKWVKEYIYGKRLVVFAPLYISNLCANECVYCAFRVRNKEVRRRALTQDEIRREVEVLIDQGHKRVLLVAGESYPVQGFRYVLDSVATVYSVKKGKGEIRRVNVNVAPLSIEEYRQLKDVNIGTYQIFQETYNRETYSAVHVEGKKRDYDWRVGALHRAMEAGIKDVGIGILFGLYDWKFEVLAMLQHISHLEAQFGVGPHTISVPRIEPATGSIVATNPPFAVSNTDFRKIVAILRIAVPYTGIIMSTRETTGMRRETFALGVSQISAGSRTNPGGYNAGAEEVTGQFSLGDHRGLEEVIRDVAQLGYIPSFCTGCYRLGRTGADFMDLAKPGKIKAHCDPNAVSTFLEYLLDYASPETKALGEKQIQSMLAEIPASIRSRTEKLIAQVREGKHDVFC